MTNKNIIKALLFSLLGTLIGLVVTSLLKKISYKTGPLKQKNIFSLVHRFNPSLNLPLTDNEFELSLIKVEVEKK